MRITEYNWRFPGLIFRLPALLIMAALWILSSRDTLPKMEGIPGLDKILHFIAYAALAAASGLWFSKESWLRQSRRNFLISAAVASVYGIVDEFHQYFVPGRTSDIGDWIADTLGGMAGAAVILLVVRTRKI